MFATGFQSVAFQTVVGLGGAQPTGHGYSYQTPYQRHRIAEQEERIKQQKTDLQKVESVIQEYERRKEITADSLARVSSKRQEARLLTAQNELISEISRLLEVRAELMAKLRQEEDALILMLIFQRKLRVFNPSKLILAKQE